VRLTFLFRSVRSEYIMQNRLSLLFVLYERKHADAQCRLQKDNANEAIVSKMK
jgi:hypothetical protein